MDLGFNLAQSNRDLKDLTSRQIFGDTSGLLCKNDLILRLIVVKYSTKTVIYKSLGPSQTIDLPQQWHQNFYIFNTPSTINSAFMFINRA